MRLLRARSTAVAQQDSGRTTNAGAFAGAVAVFFLLPLLAMARFSLEGAKLGTWSVTAWKQIASYQGTGVPPLLSSIEITLETQREEVYLTLDGQEGRPVRAGDRIRISRAAAGARLVATGQDYFHLLRTKLKWGERLVR